jgi:fimbrial chaperone protein
MRRLHVFAFAAACWAVSGSEPAIAGEFVVQPLRVDLNPTTRSSALSVRNESKERLSFQIQAVEWTQGVNGEDKYAETSELVVFPRLMTVEPDQHGVIRVGTRTPIVPTEKTYRIFIEELPSNIKQPTGQGLQVSVLMRIGIPIFVGPAKPQDGLEVEALELQKGTVSLAARNTGNRHQVIRSIRLKGTDASGHEVYAMTLADRYLLTGASKGYITSIPADQCLRIAALAVEYETDRAAAKRDLSVNRSMCR